MHLGSKDYIAEVDHAQHYLILLIGFFFSLFAFYSYFSGCFGLCYFFISFAAHRGTGRVIFSLDFMEQSEPVLNYSGCSGHL